MDLSHPIKKLERRFYTRYVLDVAPALLGKYLVKEDKTGIISGRIVEVEAYDGAVDEAAHTFNGMTERNKVMFMPGGHLYVYFTYGMHFCCNVVTGNEGEGCAVLIRAIEPSAGIDKMAINRFGRQNITLKERINLANGPAKITQAFGIERKDNGTDLAGSKIYILNAPAVPEKKITRAKRIGIKKSVDLLWRFYISDNPYISKK